MLLYSFGDNAKCQIMETRASHSILMLQDLHPSIARSKHALHCVICKAANGVLWAKDIALENILVIPALWRNLLHFGGQEMLLIFV